MIRHEIEKTGTETPAARPTTIIKATEQDNVQPVIIHRIRRLITEAQPAKKFR
jgi:hypothetical protein